MKKVFWNMMEGYSRTVNTYAGVGKSLHEIRDHLSQFLGGSIDLLKKDEGIAIVTLNHENKRNAISGKMMVDLQHIVNELDLWKEGKGVILKGSGQNFCSGGDLDFARSTGTADEGFMMATFMHNILTKFQQLPLISVALVEGVGALGGGAELSVACDFRIISESCKGIGFVHAKMGILPAWGGTNRLVHTVGHRKALDLLSTARIAAPSECLRIGLVDEVIPDGVDNTEYAVSWLRNRTKYDAEIIRSVKTSVTIAKDSPLDFETERRIFAPFWGSSGNKEALWRNIKHRPEK